MTRIGAMVAAAAVASAVLASTHVIAAEQDAPDGRTAQAKVVTASFIGSPGHEWLSAGGVLPDGNILLCGVSIDPDLTLMGIKAEVLGRDAPPLPVVKGWRRLASVGTGKVELPSLDNMGGPSVDDEFGDLLLTKKEQERKKKRKAAEKKALEKTPKDFRWSRGKTVEQATVYRKLTWADAEATGFVGIFSPDLKKVIKLRRLPRGAGSITDAGVAEDGSIYIAGGATERIRRAGSDVEDVPVLTQGGRGPEFMCPMIYLARLSSDLSEVEWIRTAPRDITGPRVRVLKNGEVSMSCPDVRFFSPTGELLRSDKISRSRWPSSTSVNPVNGRYVKGGDFLTKTGREPYRTPYYFVYNPDGSMELELFRWRGPFAGLDSLRLVADAQVKKTIHDDFGHLTVFSRSHGGNCVCLRYPYDIDRFMPNGLGALAMNSPCYVVKMDLDYQVIASGVWADPGFTRGAGYGADGSVAWIGKGRGRRVNPIDASTRGGKYIGVASPMLDAIRFGSVMPACGERVVVGGGPQVEDWNTATGTSNGRPLLMFLTGAVDKDETLEGTFTPPLRNPVQPRFGGGVMDGYVVLLDLSPGEPKVRKQEEIPTAEKRIIESEPPLLPAENQVWSLGGESYFNVQLTLREKPETGLWPRFYHGRADEGGKFIYTTAEDGETDATFMLRAHHLEQGDGDQSRRLFGTQLSYKRVPDGKDRKGRPQTRYVPTPRIEFELTGMSPWRLEEQRHERNDSIRVSQQPVCTVQGALLVDGRRVEIPEARCTGYFSFPRKVVETPDIKPNKAMLRIYFTVTGHDLGITGDQADKRVQVRWACTAYSSVKYDRGIEDLEPPPMKLAPIGSEFELD